MIDENVSTIKVGGFKKYHIRNIPVIMMAADENDQDQELVINFNDNGQIDEILVALESNRYQDIIREGVEPEDFARRQIILDFVEQFRTAYNRKDLNYISSVFSDNALIITGKVLKSVKQSDNMINQLGIVLFGLTTLFSLITLPVEYNASARAVEWLDATGITTGKENAYAKDALKWAARTYLVAALSSLATLLYYIYIFLGRRD